MKEGQEGIVQEGDREADKAGYLDTVEEAESTRRSLAKEIQQEEWH